MSDCSGGRTLRRVAWRLMGQVTVNGECDVRECDWYLRYGKDGVDQCGYAAHCNLRKNSDLSKSLLFPKVRVFVESERSLGKAGGKRDTES